MPLLDADISLAQVRGIRRVWLPGANSSGKSAMAFMFAHEMALRWGYRIVSNTECIWNAQTEPDFDDEMMLHVIVIADEGAPYFKTNEDVNWVNKYAGKMDIILMCPSVDEPAPDLQVVTIQRMAGFRSIGVPVDNWECRINVEKKRERFKFSWVGMEEIFGVYSTLHPAYSAEGIKYWVKGKIQQFVDYYLSKKYQPVDWLEPYAIRAEQELEEARRYTRRRGSRMAQERGSSELLASQVAKVKKTGNEIEALLERAEERRGRGKGLIDRIL